MEYRQLGRAGIRVSAVGLGTNDLWGSRVYQETVSQILWAALDQGINYVDTTNLYGTWYHSTPLVEEALGRALEGIRHRIVLGIKGGNATGETPNDWGASRGHLIREVEASLRFLRTDYVDLYQIHRFDETTPMEETMRTLDDLVCSGKVRYVGVSHWAAWQICRCNDLAERYGWAPFVTTQAYYNLLERQAAQELIPFCREMRVGLLPYFPLANGLLTRRYSPGAPPPLDSHVAAFARTHPYLARYATPEGYAVLQRLIAWAKARGHTLADLAIAWLLAEPATSCVIMRVSTPEQIRANAQAVGWRLSAEELAEIESLLEDRGQA